MFGRKLRTCLDIIIPNGSNGHGNQSYPITKLKFNSGSTVWVKNYPKGDKWMPGTVVKNKGAVIYEIKLNNEQLVTRHADQLRIRDGNHAHPDNTNSEENCFEDQVQLIMNQSLYYLLTFVWKIINL